ncbi:hypothetical protein K461DRAFT_289787 [Myriangium duriaei CBS 260.36]|uniref:Uncharacterized protein n=1 Tax=Myriangium duriaei CBS 260.36 TaxID=1168546 RepID=A0A9P4JB98_9PEZI|nr:hypothetical protein K461DRAFT_289787 [Myriangium duriaei CBS 260.36]
MSRRRVSRQAATVLCATAIKEETTINQTKQTQDRTIMVSGHEGKLSDASDEADLAQAFQAIAQGEQTAAQLEAHLTKLETKIDELMKQANENTELAQQAKTDQAGSSEAGTATKPTSDSHANGDESK